MNKEFKIWISVSTILVILTVVVSVVYLNQGSDVQNEVSEIKMMLPDANMDDNSVTDSKMIDESSVNGTDSTKVVVKTKEIYDLLSFSAKDFSVSKEIVPFDYTSKYLMTTSQECGNKKTKAYFDDLVTKFAGTSKLVYKFTYNSPSQTGDFVVTLIPNKTGYLNLDQFKSDFDICAAGASAYPKMMSADWLLFESSCGTGYSDGSNKPDGCSEIKQIVSPSLKLN